MKNKIPEKHDACFFGLFVINFDNIIQNFVIATSIQKSNFNLFNLSLFDSLLSFGLKSGLILIKILRLGRFHPEKTETSYLDTLDALLHLFFVEVDDTHFLFLILIDQFSANGHFLQVLQTTLIYQFVFRSEIYGVHSE